jgi:hypothetical protein
MLNEDHWMVFPKYPVPYVYQNWSPVTRRSFKEPATNYLAILAEILLAVCIILVHTTDLWCGQQASSMYTLNFFSNIIPTNIEQLA